MIVGILWSDYCLVLPYGFAIQREHGYHISTGRIVHVSNESIVNLIAVMKKKPELRFFFLKSIAQ